MKKVGKLKSSQVRLIYTFESEKKNKDYRVWFDFCDVINRKSFVCYLKSLYKSEAFVQFKSFNTRGTINVVSECW